MRAFVNTETFYGPCGDSTHRKCDDPSSGTCCIDQRGDSVPSIWDLSFAVKVCIIQLCSYQLYLQSYFLFFVLSFVISYGENAFVSIWHSTYHIDIDRCFLNRRFVYYFDFFLLGVRVLAVRLSLSVCIRCDNIPDTSSRCVLSLCLINERTIEGPDTGNGKNWWSA